MGYLCVGSQSFVVVFVGHPLVIRPIKRHPGTQTSYFL